MAETKEHQEAPVELERDLERVFQLVGRIRRGKGLGPLPQFLKERLRAVLYQALTEAGELSPEQREAVESAGEVLRGLAWRLNLTLEDLANALEYWHRKEVIPLSQYRLLHPLLLGEPLPPFEVEDLRSAVFAFANRCLRSLSGRRGVRLARMGVSQRKGRGGGSS